MAKKPPANPADLLKQMERLEVQEARLKRERLELARRLIAAGQALGGADLDAEPTQRAKPKQRAKKRPRQVASIASPRVGGRRPSDESWTATMLKILERAGSPMTYGELKAEVAKTHLGPKLERTDKSLYGGVGKLETKKLVVRHNGRIFLPKAYEQFRRDVEAGIVRDKPMEQSPRTTSPVKEALLRLLKARPDGMRPAEIMGALESFPELELSTKNSKTAVYNLIGRLVKRGEISKGNGVYWLADKNEAPDAFASGAPKHNGGGSGNPSSSGNGGLHSLAAAPGAIPAHSGE